MPSYRPSLTDRLNDARELALARKAERSKRPRATSYYKVTVRKLQAAK